MVEQKEDGLPCRWGRLGKSGINLTWPAIFEACWRGLVCHFKAWSGHEFSFSPPSRLWVSCPVSLYITAIVLDIPLILHLDRLLLSSRSSRVALPLAPMAAAVLALEWSVRAKTAISLSKPHPFPLAFRWMVSQREQGRLGSLFGDLGRSARVSAARRVVRATVQCAFGLLWL